MANIFNSILVKKPQSNLFNLSYDHKTTFRMGSLNPHMVLECVPGDKFTIQSEAMIRFAPLLAPIMHRVDVTQHFFFVPNRLVWDNWEKFITGGENPDTVNPVFPTVIPNFGANNYIADVMGIPEDQGDDPDPFEVNAIPFAAYQLIWNEFYRDQNLQAPLLFPKLQDGSQGISGSPRQSELNTLRFRAWQHDYFTSSLPFAQKGADVDIPLGSVAPIDQEDMDELTTRATFKSYADQTFNEGSVANTDDIPTPYIGVGGAEIQSYYDPAGTLQVEPTTINTLRRAFKLQEWLEKNARGGTRYIESILSHFGVRSSDARLQRPQFLGGSRQPVVISEVLQNSATIPSEEDPTTPLATMAGHAISVGAGKPIKYFCEEHGFIIGIINIQPRTAYQQGLHKMWSKIDRFDYFWPSFAHIGEEPVLKKEIYFDSTDGENDATWGYVPRYSDYRFMNSRVSGEFKNSLSFWHMGRIFDARPELNEDFIQSFPTTRIFAVDNENEQNLWCHIYNNIRASRRMPVYGTPTF